MDYVHCFGGTSPIETLEGSIEYLKRKIEDHKTLEELQSELEASEIKLDRMVEDKKESDRISKKRTERIYKFELDLKERQRQADDKQEELKKLEDEKELLANRLSELDDTNDETQLLIKKEREEVEDLKAKIIVIDNEIHSGEKSPYEKASFFGKIRILFGL